MMVIDHRFDYFESVRSRLSVLTYPLQKIAEAPVVIPTHLYQFFATRSKLHWQIETLHQENLKLKARMQRMMVLEDENQRLMMLLNSSQRIGERILIAEVSAIVMNPFKHRIRINKGTNSNVFLGQPVLNADAVVGQVIHVNPFSADVLLITDSEHALPIQIKRNGLRTIAVGDSLQSLSLPYLANNADIQEKDILITSGMGGRFPNGYPVAVISSITTNNHSPFAKISATPIAQLDKIRETMLVWQIKKRQPSNAEK